jgi:hypothetical protein
MRQVRFGERLRRPCKDKMAGTGAYSGGFAGERAANARGPLPPQHSGPVNHTMYFN